MSAVLGLLAVLVLTAGTGYFVAQEFAYVAADRLALTREAAAGDKRAARAVKVLERLSFMLSGAQLGITVTGLVVGFLAEPALAELLRPLLSGVGIPDAAVSGIALFLAFALATVIQMVLGELAPKNLALAIPERLAKSLSASTVAYLKVAGPLIRVFDAAANRILRRIGIEPVEELHHGATLEELGHLIGESHDHGQLPRANADLLESALEFSERRLGEVMVPRVDVDTVPEAASGEEVALLIARRGHSHYPVLGQRTDDVVGIVGVRELMPLPAGQLAQRTARALARPALFLPDSLPLPGAVAHMEAAGRSSPWSWTSTAGWPGSSPSRTSPKNSSVRSPTRATASCHSPSATARAGSSTRAAASTKRPRPPASPCPRTTISRPSPDWSSTGSAACPSSATSSPSPSPTAARPRSRSPRWTGTCPNVSG